MLPVAWEDAMSRAVSRIMLAVQMLFTAAMLYIFVVWGLHSSYGRFPYPRDAVYFIADLVTALFVFAFWVLIWRSSVAWSSRRVVLTVGAACGSAAIGSGLGWIADEIDGELAMFAAGVVAVVGWLIATCFIWRENRVERATRLRRAERETIACLNCGYNMTGLREPKCPECGASFTLDELLRGQASRDPAELSQ